MVKTVPSSAGLASTMSAFPNSTVAEPDYSERTEAVPVITMSCTRQNYVINEYIGLANASSVMTDMTNDLDYSTLKAKLDCD